MNIDISTIEASNFTFCAVVSSDFDIFHDFISTFFLVRVESIQSVKYCHNLYVIDIASFKIDIVSFYIFAYVIFPLPIRLINFL